MKSVGYLYAPRETRFEESARSIFLECGTSSQIFSICSTDGLHITLRGPRRSQDDVCLEVVAIGGPDALSFASLKGATLHISGDARVSPSVPLICRADYVDGPTAYLRLPGVDRVSYR